jgi:hypothetical protein
MANRPTYCQQRNSGMWPPILLQAARLAIWLLSRPFVWFYRIADLIFDLDKRGAASNLKRLTEEVESECDYLFSKYGGRVVPELSNGSPAMDFATVVVEVKSLHLRATRDRGFTGWEITAPASRYPWQPLELVCQRFAHENGRPSSTFRLLVDHFPEIEQLFASNSWISPIRP